MRRLLVACLRWTLVHLADASMGIGCLCLEWEERLSPHPRHSPPAAIRPKVLGAIEATDSSLLTMRDAANRAALAMRDLREALPIGCRGVTNLTYLSGTGRETTCHVIWEERQLFDPKEVN